MSSVCVARRHYFVKSEPRTHHLHLVETDGPQWTATLLLRDGLPSDPELAKRYATAEEDLARRRANDRAVISREADRSW